MSGEREGVDEWIKRGVENGVVGVGWVWGWEGAGMVVWLALVALGGLVRGVRRFLQPCMTLPPESPTKTDELKG